MFRTANAIRFLVPVMLLTQACEGQQVARVGAPPDGAFPLLEGAPCDRQVNLVASATEVVIGWDEVALGEDADAHLIQTTISADDVLTNCNRQIAGDEAGRDVALLETNGEVRLHLDDLPDVGGAALFVLRLRDHRYLQHWLVPVDESDVAYVLVEE